MQQPVGTVSPLVVESDVVLLTCPTLRKVCFPLHELEIDRCFKTSERLHRLVNVPSMTDGVPLIDSRGDDVWDISVDTVGEVSPRPVIEWDIYVACLKGESCVVNQKPQAYRLNSGPEKRDVMQDGCVRDRYGVLVII
jgi:hypothetical protein